MTKTALFGSAISIAVWGLGGAALAQVQSPPPAPSAQATASTPAPAVATAAGVTEVVVTATRRESNLQTTAADVTAISGQTLIDKSVHNFEDIGRVAPDVQVSNSQGIAQVYIRGIGTPLRGAGLGEGSTALLNDGVYIANASDASTGYFDLKRIEVLAGPQGALYGRNATSGAINVITADPTTDFEGYGRITAGNYNRFTEEGAISGPIYGDSILGRLAFQKNDHDGYMTLFRANGGEDHAQDLHDVSIRGKLDFRINSHLDMLVTATYYHEDDKAVAFNYFDAGFVGAAPYEAQVAASGISAQNSRKDNSAVDFYNKRTFASLTDKITYDLNGYTLSSTTSLRSVELQFQDDLGFTSLFTADQHHGESAHQFSQDFLFTSPAHQLIEWIAGASYFHYEDTLTSNYFIPTAGEDVGKLNITHAPYFGISPTCCNLVLSGATKNTAYDGFADITLNATSRLKFKLGGRYTVETIGGTQDVGVLDIGNQFAAFNVVPHLPSHSFYAFTPRGDVEYTFTPDIFAYVSYTQGFKSGGYNIGDFSQDVPFNPEKVTSYEGGLKTRFFDRRLTLDLAVYDYEYKNLQVQEDLNNSINIQNAATATIKGVSVNGNWRVLDHTVIDYAFNYLDAQFDKFTSVEQLRPALGVQNLSGRYLPKAPKYSFSGGIEQTKPLASGAKIVGRVDYSIKSTYYEDPFNEPALEQKTAGELGARLAYRSPDGHWDVALYGLNLTDELIKTNAFYTGGVIGSEDLGQYAPPRTYGIEAGYRF
jgi:iron complex outermembrane receptor protein